MVVKIVRDAAFTVDMTASKSKKKVRNEPPGSENGGIHARMRVFERKRTNTAIETLDLDLVKSLEVVLSLSEQLVCILKELS